MKKILAGLFIFGALTIGVRQASAFTLNDALLQIQNLEKQISQLKASLLGSALSPDIPTPPTLGSTAVVAFTETTVTLSSSVTSLGYPPSLTARGTCYGLVSQGPMTNCLSDGGNATGPFSQTRSGLTSNTKYLAISYATNGTATNYGSVVSFTTSPAPVVPSNSAPLVSGVNYSSVTSSSAVLSVTSLFPGYPTGYTNRGICYNANSISATPTTLNANCLDSVNSQTIITASGLSSSTTYKFRGYAKNTAGLIGYSEEGTFTTSAALAIQSNFTVLPVLSIYPIMQDYYAQTYVTLGMEIISRGTPAVTTPLLIYYGTTPHPTTSSVSIPLSANSIYQYKVSNLTCGTKYYYYGSIGLAVSNDSSFTTAQCAVTPTLVNIYTSAGSNGTIYPTGPVSIASGTGATQNFTITPATGYTSTVGGTCGGSLSGNVYTTAQITGQCTVTATFAPTPVNNYVPTVSLPTSQSFTSTSAILGASVTDLGSPATITYRGVCYEAPLISGSGKCLNSTSTSNSISISVSGLVANTAYKYRGFATNATGTGYSEYGTFATPAVTALVNLYTSFGPNGTITPSGTTQINSGVGLTQKYTVTPNAGYTPTMSGCSGSLSGNVYTTAPITSQCTVTATFAPTPVNTYVPTVSSPIAQNITSTSAIMSASVTGLGSPATITSRGICYGPSTVAITPDCITSTSNTVTAYPTNLTPGTIYKFRGFAINATGTGYSEYKTFTTLGTAGPCLAGEAHNTVTGAPCDSTAPSVTVTSPNGEESYTVGQQVLVRWQSYNYPSTGYVQVVLKSTQFDTGIVILDGLLNDGEEMITIPSTGGPGMLPLISGKYYKIYVSIAGNNFFSDVSNDTFTINPSSTTPSITVLSPNIGNEVYTAGQQITVKWTATNTPVGAVAGVSLVDSINNSNNYILDSYCTSSKPCVDVNTGTYTFYIPQDISTGKYKVRVYCANRNSEAFCGYSTNPSHEDFSDNYFTINSSSTAPSVAVTYPNGGESYTVGQQVLVKWQSYNYPSTGYVQVVLKSTQFDTGIVILDGLLNDGEEMITIPSTGGPGMLPLISGKYYKIYVSIAGNNFFSDVSNDTFTINSSAKMNSEDNGCLPGYKFSTTISNYLCPDSSSLKSASIVNPDNTNNVPINRTLKWGTRGDDVKKLQQFLGIGADGIFGRGTEAAVKAWQATKGLTPDGLFGYYSRTTAGL